MPVSKDAVAGHPVYRGGRDSLEATIKWIIAWGDIDAFYLELFPGAVGGFPSPPAKLAGSSVLYADDVTFEPFIGEGDVPTCGGDDIAEYTYALATATFRTIPYSQQKDGSDNPAGQLITRRYGISGEVLVLPSSALEWAANPNDLVPQDVNAGLIVPTVDITVQLHRVTAAFFSSLLSNIEADIGCINNASFEGFAAYTLLLLGADATQTVAADGTTTYEVEVKFQYKNRPSDNGLDVQAQGWNIFLNPASGEWRYLRKKDGSDIFTPTDFSVLYS